MFRRKQDLDKVADGRKGENAASAGRASSRAGYASGDNEAKCRGSGAGVGGWFVLGGVMLVLYQVIVEGNAVDHVGALVDGAYSLLRIVGL